MPRKPTPTAAPAETPALPAEKITTAQLAAASAYEQSKGWMQAAQAGGVLQAMSFMRTVADSALVDMYDKVKKSKSYVGMPYVDESGKPATVATIEDYCRVFLGKSYRRCEELLSNRDLLGIELYDHTEKVGLRQRDYNAIKALPADDQALIKQAIEDGADRETIIEQLVTLAERQQAERQRLSDELQEARADNAAKDQRINKLSDDLNKEHEKLAKAQRKWKAADVDERQLILQNAVVAAEMAVLAQLGAAKDGLRGAVKALAEHCAEHGTDVTGGEFLGDMFGRLLNGIRTVRDDEELAIAIPIVSDAGEDA